MNRQFFIDMAPVMPTFYNELGLATGAGDAQTDGSPSSTSHGGDQATFNFSDSGFDTSLAYGMGNPYAPFDGPCFSYDLLLTQPSWNTDDPFDLGNYGLPSFSSSLGTGEVASESALPQATQHTERQFALDISNGQGRVGEQASQPPSGSSSHISAIKVEIPMNLPHNEETIHIATASSSPARRSARQRGSTASSTSHKTKRATRAKSAKSSHPAKSSNSSGTESGTQTATQTAQRVKHKCVHPGCPSTFYDRPTMHRHVLTIHLKIRPPCPGCHNTFSRDDSLKRHLETRPIDSHCRAAAREDGWEETEHDGKVKMTARQQRDRVQIIVDVYGTS